MVMDSIAVLATWLKAKEMLIAMMMADTPTIGFESS